VAGIAVVLYALAAVLQTIGARRATSDPEAAPAVRDLLRERAWVLGVVMLGLAFLAFVLSTRVLPLPVAEIVRSFYPVLTVILEHLVFETRVRAGELLGAALVLVGPVLVAASGGERGQEQATVRTAAVMLAVLVTVVALSSIATRAAGLSTVNSGAAQAVLAGLAFTVVDLGVRSLPDPFSIAGALATPACWIGALAAPIGLLLFSRAVARTSAGLATVLLTVVNVVTASAWSEVAFHDTSGAGSGRYVAAAAAAALGLWLMRRAAQRDVVAPAGR